MIIQYLRHTLNSGTFKKTKDSARGIAPLYVGIFVLLNIWDLLATMYVVQHKGIEIMPMAKYILDNYGSFGLACWKVIIPALLCVMLMWASNYTPKIVFNRIALAATILMFIACLLTTMSAMFIAHSP